MLILRLKDGKSIDKNQNTQLQDEQVEYKHYKAKQCMLEAAGACFGDRIVLHWLKFAHHYPQVHKCPSTHGAHLSAFEIN